MRQYGDLMIGKRSHWILVLSASAIFMITMAL